MRKYFCFFTSLVILASEGTVSAQKLIPNSSVTGVCYAGNKTNRIYIPPPDEFFKKSGATGGASIRVIYSGFPDNAIPAVAYAASILESILPAGTKIVISASWERITTSGVLASSSITGFASGWTVDAWNPLVLYPVALAEKIAGRDLNDSLAGDITLRINNSVNWYLGTDGNTPGLKYDLVTIVLHEVCHGLGFYDSMNTDNTIGWFGIGGFPMIYDSFIQNAAGVGLTDTLIIPNHSQALRRELIGGNLFIIGPLLSNYTTGIRSRIYSPPVWDPGSSVSHLDELATAEPNTLMTPYIDKGEAIHNPGKLTMSILGDLGWINTRIIHKARHDTEQNLGDLQLSVTIASDTLYDHSNIGAVFSFDHFASSDTLLMTSPGSDNNFNCSISVAHYNSEIQYYFYALDCFHRLYKSPSLSDSIRYTVYIGTDTIKPVITHTPLTDLLEKIDTIQFLATVTDNLGVDTVNIEYRLNEGPWTIIGLKTAKESNYEASLNARSLSLKGGDSIQYRIVAVDSAKVSNTALLPVSGYYTIHFEGLNSVVETYFTDFTGEATADFINNGFEVYKTPGFSKYGLNSKHPYESPEDNNKTVEYTSILRHPLKFNPSGIMISLDEVVLVEPGEQGSLFGSEAFYDYVILEGSKNFGKTWFKLEDGYDSRFFKTWETAYNGSITGNNSTALGTESMLHRHNILYGPSNNISAGDTLLLRFRLFSDPFANGWGWVIENLKINPLVDAVEKVNSNESLKVFPNPGQGMVRITMDPALSGIGKPIHYYICTTSGVCIENGYLNGDTDNLIDISDHPAGIYIIILNNNNRITTIKYSLIK